jgi:hypothetical protein
LRRTSPSCRTGYARFKPAGAFRSSRLPFGGKAPRGSATHLENAVSICVSHVRTVSVAVGVAILLAMGGPTIAPAATKEEVSRCRAIWHHIRRRDCFESLKEVPKAKTEDPPKAKTEEAPKAKTGNTSSPAVPDDPAATTSIDHLSAAPSQPLCVDRDALAAMLVAGVLASSPTEVTTNGCQTIPEDAKVELLERYPSALHFLRVIKVKVISPAQPDSTVGFTIETGR